ncbi:MAG: alpha/beta hydrolase [Crocinitomicaceae bacterium]|nr:alpha/beta hydrolase [Crocinitomicaceae bacterium]
MASCVKDIPKPEKYDSTKAYTLQDISYGNNDKQKIDIYLPANRNAGSTKVFVLIHGGGWSGGDKSEYTDVFNSLKSVYPDHAIININYRLADASSPGYPKQINDIDAALKHIQAPAYSLSKQYFLFGTSAGGHLAMLYGYAFDTDHFVKGICNTVGPTDMTDPAYTDNPIYLPVITGLVGYVTYQQNPALYEEVSPAKRVTDSSPPTISFFGGMDPLIPSSQMPRLHDVLNAHNVYNEATLYPGAGHGGWDEATSLDMATKIMNFIEHHF